MKKVYLTLSGLFVAVGTLMASDGIDKREYHVSIIVDGNIIGEEDADFK